MYSDPRSSPPNGADRSAASPKRCYQAPRLKALGSLASLTRGPYAGSGDALLGTTGGWSVPSTS